MHYIQLVVSDLHQIAKSFLVTTAQYSKLEKELEKEWKLSVGWFKPSKLNEVTGETVRDKQKRELALKKQTMREMRRDGAVSNVAGAVRKRIERVNTQTLAAEPLVRRRVGKVSSNNRVTEAAGGKGSAAAKEGLLPADKKPASKRQQSLLNVNLGSMEKQGSAKPEKKAGQSSSSARVKDDDALQPVEERGKTQKKPKGLKILAVTQEDQGAVTASQSMVTRLKSWKEFFEPDEFRRGSDAMKQSSGKKKKKKKRAAESDEEKESVSGSDSEPSVDNFDMQELEDHLCAALDPADPEKSPFLRPIAENVDDVYSEDSEADLNRAKEEDAEHSLSDKESEPSSKPQKLVLPKTITPALSSHNEDADVSETPCSRQSLPSTAKSKQAVRSSSHNPSQLAAQQLEQERSRIYNFPELANQLINQLILRNNALSIKASAAPPSGSGKQPPPAQPSDFGQNHMIRGVSYMSQLPQFQHAQPLPSSSDGQHEKIYITDNHRRMAQRKQP